MAFRLPRQLRKIGLGCGYALSREFHRGYSGNQASNKSGTIVTCSLPMEFPGKLIRSRAPKKQTAEALS